MVVSSSARVAIIRSMRIPRTESGLQLDVTARFPNTPLAGSADSLKYRHRFDLTINSAMTRYKELLFESLFHHGWEVVSRLKEDDWWAEEHWQVRSVRDHWGYELFLSFLVDPMYEGQKKSSAVWAVAANQLQPSDRPLAEDSVSLLRVHDVRFPESLQIFVSDIDAIRRHFHDPTPS